MTNRSQTIQPRPVATIVPGVPATDGAGVRILRLLGTTALPMLDPFLLLDMLYSDRPQDYIAGFPSHPHRGFETVTYVLAGRVRHADNKGHTGVIEAGGVQWMTAGRGIIHSEMPEQIDGLLWGFQLWINLPAADKMTSPRYQEFEAREIPVEERSPGTQVRVIAGQTSLGTTGPIQSSATEPIYWDVNIAPGHQFIDSLPITHQAFIAVYEGNVTVGGNDTDTSQSISAGTLAILGTGSHVTVSTDDRGAKFLLIAGKPLGEPVAHGGPFVMNTQAEVLQAYYDYQQGLF
ncbi:MAG: pirin family protein [Cyanobacteria bacterium]|nr:pirin family protein [Cyanobacteriota bacterium]MDW8203002.1 pirin family protein [Cyanobacteriota bacterium SKYGB_h_bin112]